MNRDDKSPESGRRLKDVGIKMAENLLNKHCLISGRNFPEHQVKDQILYSESPAPEIDKKPSVEESGLSYLQVDCPEVISQ